MSEIYTNDIKIQKECRIQPVIYPIVTSSTYKIDISELDKEKYTYSRSDNPSRDILERNLAVLEKCDYALTFSSGLGVLTALSFTDMMKKGVIASHDLYGGTKRFFNQVWQRPVMYLNFQTMTDGELKDCFRNTNITTIWLETPSNPLLQVLDLKKIVKIAHQYDKKVIVDNTFLSPIFQNPLQLDVDIVVHSITKYINGMSDVIMGCLMTRDKTIYKRLKFLQNALGIIPSPFDCYNVNRSIKTLSLRMIQHQSNAIELVKLLEKHPKIKKVLYPKRIECQMTGQGGMISFYLSNECRYQDFFTRLEMIPTAESLGGVETLIEHPATMTHASVEQEEREKLGITSQLVRLSVGLEPLETIYNDINQALL